MEEPLLGSRKRPNALFTSGLFQIPEEALVKDPEFTPIMSPHPSSIKERLIFGSPDTSPGSHFVWLDCNSTADQSNNEAEMRDSLEDSEDPCSCGSYANETNDRIKGSDVRKFDDSFMDNRIIGSSNSGMRLNTDLTRLDLAASPRYRPMPLWSMGTRKLVESRDSENMDLVKDAEKQSHSVPVSPEATSDKTNAECRTCTKKHYHRSRTAPAMAVMGDRAQPHSTYKSTSSPSSAVSISVVTQACIGLLLYLIVGVAIFTWMEEDFSGTSTQNFVDALYFCIVTMCTIGYGDITPTTPFAKLFSCVFVLVGFGFIDILLSGMVNYVLDSQEAILLNAVAAGHHETAKSYLVDIKKGRMRIRLKVALAFGVVIICIGVGTFVMHFLETLGWLDSFYLACMSVTTVGYGDHAFKTMPGRLFAAIWLLVSTLAVARSFLYLAEARIDKRHRLIAKLVLEKEMTLGDLVAADLDNDGCVRYAHHFLILRLLDKVSLFFQYGIGLLRIKLPKIRDRFLLLYNRSAHIFEFGSLFKDYCPMLYHFEHFHLSTFHGCSICYIFSMLRYSHFFEETVPRVPFVVLLWVKCMFRIISGGSKIQEVERMQMMYLRHVMKNLVLVQLLPSSLSEDGSFGRFLMDSKWI